MKYNKLELIRISLHEVVIKPINHLGVYMFGFKTGLSVSNVK